jgi:hypothetical protein
MAHLSRDKVLQFASMLPEMDRDVALQVIEQFPEFRLLALDALSAAEQQAGAIVEANQQGQEKVHSAFADVRRILEAELGRDGLTREDRWRILQMINETAERQLQADSENKRFMDSVLGKVAMVGVAAVALGGAVLGGRAITNDHRS